MAALLEALNFTAGALQQLGAPARDAAAAEAHAQLRADLVTAQGEGPAAVARIAVRALRLLAVLLRALRVDAANACLRLLASQLSDGSASRYALQSVIATH